MEKEMRVLGYQPELLSVRDAGGFFKALQNCAQPDALILCPLSGNLRLDAACTVHVASNGANAVPASRRWRRSASGSWSQTRAR